MSDIESDTHLPQIRRVRHELRRRDLTVARTERLTPHMIRVTLEGSALEDFASAAPDDHLKLFLPLPDGTEAAREYTPRSFDTAAGSLVVDVVDHPGGPAADWARGAAVGDAIRIGGPRGSQVIEGPIAHWLLVGDETALPAIGRRIEEAAPGTAITAIIGVPGPEDRQDFATAATLDVRWLHRPLDEATDPAPYLDALADVALPEATFAWVAAEAGVARAIRTLLLDRGHPKPWIKASGYWIQGQADSSQKTMED